MLWLTACRASRRRKLTAVTASHGPARSVWCPPTPPERPPARRAAEALGTGRAPLSQTREGPPSVALSQVGVRLGRQFSPHPAPKGKSQRGQSPVALQGRGPQDSWAPGPCAPRGPGPAPRMATVPVVGHGPAMLVAQARPVCPHRGEMVSALGTPEPGHSHTLLPRARAPRSDRHGVGCLSSSGCYVPPPRQAQSGRHLPGA